MRGRRSARGATYGVALAGLLSVGCPSADDGEGSGDDGAEPSFPEDYRASYTEVRDCRGSGDHDLNNIRILVDPAARTAYEGRTEAFPVDAVVLKEEYDFGDTTCSGALKQWTVMRKLPAGSADDTLDWHWEQVDADRHVVEQNASRCIGCHQGCGVAPDGYDWTCAIP